MPVSFLTIPPSQGHVLVCLLFSKTLEGHMDIYKITLLSKAPGDYMLRK